MLLHSHWLSIFEYLGSVQWGDSHVARTGSRDRTQMAPVSNRAGGYVSLDGQPEAGSQMPFMDHWNASHPHISLRDIIKEEQALQENIEKVTHSFCTYRLLWFFPTFLKPQFIDSSSRRDEVVQTLTGVMGPPSWKKISCIPSSQLSTGISSRTSSENTSEKTTQTLLP